MLVQAMVASVQTLRSLLLPCPCPALATNFLFLSTTLRPMLESTYKYEKLKIKHYFEKLAPSSSLVPVHGASVLFSFETFKRRKTCALSRCMQRARNAISTAGTNSDLLKQTRICEAGLAPQSTHRPRRYA